jgi:hypothetical protein
LAPPVSLKPADASGPGGAHAARGGATMAVRPK